ncbi:hypothetical protein F4806DRAFT_52322 [Annulohypoxylon nitens]|nr:hypothetical protein F4806DRAFT_52322 [Annulohypoxylon nitens]
MFQLGAAISLSIGQTIFLNELKASARALVPSIPYSALVSAGAYNLHGIFGDDEDGVYDLVRRVYMNALHSTYIYPLAAAGVALIATLALENKNLKSVEMERKKTAEEKRGEGHVAKEPGQMTEEKSRRAEEV